MPDSIGKCAQNWIPKFQSRNLVRKYGVQRGGSFCSKVHVFLVVQCGTKNRAKDGGEKSLAIRSNQNSGLSNGYHADVLAIEFDLLSSSRESASKPPSGRGWGGEAATAQSRCDANFRPS